MPEKKLIIQNTPVMGIDTDTDEHYIDPRKARDILNGRIVGVDGKGMEITNVKGNHTDQSNGIGWNLPLDHIPLGYVTHEGICYQFSQDINPASPTFGNGEVGVFPAPFSLINSQPNATGFSKIYQPLKNFVLANLPTNHPFDPAFVGDDLDANTMSPNRQAFNTDEFNFDCENQLKVEARVDYDNSVNLYFVDDRNQYRVINSGFNHVTGEFNQRYHFPAQFQSSINAFNESASHPRITLNQVIDQGALLCGNYVFYFRYTTVDFNSTSWIGESGPVQISRSPLTEGVAIVGGPGDQTGNKTAQFTISNLDTSYQYVEVAQVHFGDDQLQTVHQIDRLFDIGNQTSITIEINGLEAKVPMDVGEIAKTKPLWNIPKTLVQLENRMFLGNIREERSFDPELVAFAEAVHVVHNVDLQENTPFYDESGGVNNLRNVVLGDSLYNDPIKTHDNVGYHRGEAYPFAIMFVLNNGQVLPPIAVRGIDYFDGTNNYGAGHPTENTKGIYRFPSNEVRPYMVPGPANVVEIMGVEFQTFGAVGPWMLANIAGAYFMRGERKPNKIFQGLVTRTYHGSTDDYKWEGGDQPGNENPQKNLHHVSQPEKKVPAILRDFPFLWRDDTGGGNPDFDGYMSYEASGYTYGVYNILGTASGVWFGSGDYNQAVTDLGSSIDPPNAANRLEAPAVWEHPDQYGFFSIDHFITNQPILQDIFFRVEGYWNEIAGDCTNSNVWIRDSLAQYPDKAWAKGMYFVDHYEYEAPASVQTYTAKAVHVQEFDKIGENDFNSYYEQGEEGSAYPFYSDESRKTYGPFIPTRQYHLKNYAFGTSRYIGLDMSNSTPSPPEEFGTETRWIRSSPARTKKPIANIYRTDPALLSSSAFPTIYDPDDTTYYKISDFVPLANLTGSVGPFYKGDCFISRTYIKSLYRDEEVYVDDQNAQEDGVMKYGMMHGAVLECDTNASLRHPDAANSNVYPATSNIGDVKKYVIEDNDLESSQYNEGYHRVLGVQGFLGFDGLLPSLRSDYPTRIMFSEFHENNAIQDFYRQFLIGSFEDFDYTYGEITEIRKLKNVLYSVQRKAINAHFVNERAMIPSTEGQLTVGSGATLSHKFQTISGEYGSQHQWSIIQSDNWIYGFDWRHRKIWRFNKEGNFELISDTKANRKFITDNVEQFGDQSDVTEDYDDSPVCTHGVVAAWDKKYNDIIFTIITEKPGISSPPESVTIAFSEWMQAFSSRYSYASPFYVSINEDFYSFDPGIFPSQALPTTTPGTRISPAYLHDVETVLGASNRLSFYGTVYPMEIVVIANKEPDAVKIFDNILLNASEQAIDVVEYENRHGAATHNWFNPSLNYIDPLYEENMWRFPIVRIETLLNPNNIPQVMQYTQGTGAPYAVGAPFRDKWLKILLRYQKQNPIFIKSVNTIVRPSRQ